MMIVKAECENENFLYTDSFNNNKFSENFDMLLVFCLPNGRNNGHAIMFLKP